MRQYLSHRRRLYDKANQAHPPAAPAALERKHLVDARQQLCPQISRGVSAPRTAAVCVRCLWQRWLTPRRQLPPSLREAAKLGFKRAVVPRVLVQTEPFPAGITVIQAPSVGDALRIVLPTG